MSAADLDRMWCVVPVAGSGSRLRPHTHTRPKPLVPVAGKPILGHILDAVVAAGLRRVALITGAMGDQIVAYVRAHPGLRDIERVEQGERLGLGHAIFQVRDVVGGDPMLIVYGDTIFRADLAGVLAARADLQLGVKQVPDPSRYGVVVEGGGRVRRLVEKPDAFVSDQAIVGVNVVRASELLFASLARLMQNQQRTQGEYQLTDAFQLMLEAGADVRTFPVADWFDCGTVEALLAANRHLLDGSAPSQPLPDCVVVPPVYVAASAQVSQCILGPYVSIGADAQVERSIAQNAIIGDKAVVSAAHLADTIVGYGACVTGKAQRLNVGDMSEVSG